MPRKWVSCGFYVLVIWLLFLILSSCATAGPSPGEDGFVGTQQPWSGCRNVRSRHGDCGG
jgi:hypothetical protein